MERRPVTCPACLRSDSQTRSDWCSCRGCGSWWRIGTVADGDREQAHDDLYFDTHATLEMNERTLLHQYARWIDRHRPLHGELVLDVGCGTSDLADEVAALGGRYIGVELSAAARAKQEARGRTVVTRLDDLGPNVRPGVVTMIEVIEHVAEPTPLLQQVRDSLAPDSLLFVTTPNAGSLAARIKRQGWEQASNPTHLILYSRRGLAQVLTRHGLRIAHDLRFADFGGSRPRRLRHSMLQGLRLDGGVRVLCSVDRTIRNQAGSRPGPVGA